MDLWALPFRNGTADGEPFLVEGNVGDYRPLGFAADGSLLYQIHSMGTNIYTADFDLTTNTIRGKPDQVIQHFEGHNTMPHWSGDGHKVVYWSYRYRPIGTFQTPVRSQQLIVLDLETGEEQVPGSLLSASSVPGERTRISPDGTKVLIAGGGNPDRGRGLVLLDVESGEWDFVRPNQESTETGSGEWTRDGSHFVYLLYHVGEGVLRPELVRRHAVRGSEEVIHRFESNPSGRLWALSPDEKRLAYVTGGNLLVVDLTTRESQKIYEGAESGGISNWAGGLTWTPDGETILFAVNMENQGEGSDLREVMSIPAEGGEASSTGLVMEELHHLTFLPDGQRIGFAAGPSATTQIWVMENLFSKDGG
jgi:Tol biopolymer transport system component